MPFNSRDRYKLLNRILTTWCVWSEYWSITMNTDLPQVNQFCRTDSWFLTDFSKSLGVWFPQNHWARSRKIYWTEYYFITWSHPLILILSVCRRRFELSIIPLFQCSHLVDSCNWLPCLCMYSLQLEDILIVLCLIHCLCFLLQW